MKTAPTAVADIGYRVRLYDVAHLMPRAHGYPARRSKIARLYVHHSGALGKSGFAGAVNTAKYVVKKRGFPGAAYHYWLPYECDRDADGYAMVYRLNDEDRRTWHTGGKANSHGVSVCLQGNTSKLPLSGDQLAVLPAMLHWLEQRLHVPVVAHSEAGKYGGKGKPACPGRDAQAWLDLWVRNGPQPA